MRLCRAAMVDAANRGSSCDSDINMRVSAFNHVRNEVDLIVVQLKTDGDPLWR